MIPTSTPTPAPTALVSTAPSMIVPVALLRSGTDRTNFQDATSRMRRTPSEVRPGRVTVVFFGSQSAAGTITASASQP